MAISSEAALLDTNILVYAMNKDAEHHRVCRALLERALVDDVAVCLTPQILFEYYAVVTSAKQITTPLTAPEASTIGETVLSSQIHSPEAERTRSSYGGLGLPRVAATRRRSISAA